MSYVLTAQANQNRRSATLVTANRSKLQTVVQEFTVSVATLAALAALGADYTGGELVWVESLRRPFVRDPTVALAIPGQVVPSTDGSGVWRSVSGFTPLAGGWLAQTEWHIDAAGSVEGLGTALSPISSWRELVSRVGGQQLPAGCVIYIHSDLPEVLDASTFIPDPTTGVEISGEPGATTVLTGTVATYTAESFVAPGEAPLLTSAAVADWTTLEGYRIRFTSGPADGAYSSVAAANPNGAGVNVARIPAPCLCAYPTPTYPVPAAGNGFVLEQLVEVLGYVPPVSNAGENILRGVAFPELVETRIQSANEVILWGCTSGDIEVDSLRINLQGCRLCSAGGFACALNGQWANIASTTIHWSLVACVVMFCDHCVWQEGFYFDSGRATMHHSGGFDTPGGDAMTLFNGAHVDLFGVWYGNGNTDYGITLLQGLCGATYLAAQPPIANGALGDAFVAGAAFAWGALPIVGANLSGIVTP